MPPTEMKTPQTGVPTPQFKPEVAKMQEVESIKDPNLLRFIDQANSEDPKSPAKQRFDTNSVSDKPYTEFVAAQDLKDLQI